MFLAILNLLYYASFFCVLALSVDRFLAIHLHLRYKELITHKRVDAVVILIWVFGALLSVMGSFVIPSRKDRYVVFATVEVSCLTIGALLYYKIYLAVRHHTNQIHSLQVHQEAQNLEMANAARLRKSVIGCTLCVSRVFVLLFTRKLYLFCHFCFWVEYHFERFVALHSVTGFFLIQLWILWFTAGRWQTFDALS